MLCQRLENSKPLLQLHRKLWENAISYVVAIIIVCYISSSYM
ncbi:hypothetical protein Pint_21852 [Pistacia integerrima]|uniref:Uncharacterized protein n=1 Tax=Pistacia integerrima TaxID=434235 RepID=A0ACC0X7F5_9ROSI|nr:hypothetical protein Pint_21852 [Pistacia integerrima]